MGSNLRDQINKFTSSNSILVHTKSKGLIRLYCPFSVEVIEAVDCHSIGQHLEVVSVKVSKDLKLVYVIGDKRYYHYYFHILI